jgi:hypothetical protein
VDGTSNGICAPRWSAAKIIGVSMIARYYTDEALEGLSDAYADLHGRCRRLQQRLAEYSFGHSQAKEYAFQGLARRFNVLVRCIDNTFRAIPPELEGVPTSDKIEDAEIQVQAFIVNVFGCLDNLAWIWVLERNITRCGAPLPQEWVGLRPPNTFVRESLGNDLGKYLENIAEWFNYLEDYRHALAHRIPLYIPPYAIDPSNLERYYELEAVITQSLIQRRIDEMEEAARERDGLKFFRPFIASSWTGRTKPTEFHRQMLSDFKTIEALSAKILSELIRSAS